MKVNYSNSVEMSTIDWSEHVSHTIFLNGCNLKCPYCYNGDVVKGNNMIDIRDLYDEITTAAEYVDSIVLSGGEPLAQWYQVVCLIQHAKKLGLKTAIHTNGMYPAQMGFLMGYVDVDAWLVDFKANPMHPVSFMKTTGLEHVPLSTINETLGILANYSGEIEIRTTVVRGLNDSQDDIRMIAGVLCGWLDADVKYVVQQGITDEAMDASLHSVAKLTREELLHLADGAAENLNNLYIRTDALGEERTMNMR